MTITRQSKPTKPKNNYFADVGNKSIQFISTGCTLLDCSLGGGIPIGRMSNIIGDYSSGKTLLAIEICANFVKDYPDGSTYYFEAEAAFDKEYASSLGMPVDKVNFIDCGEDNTIEFLFENLVKIAEKHKSDKEPVLYVVDSLDALSDRAEKERDIDKGSYGMGKQKTTSELFRREVKAFEKSGITLLFISQVRDNIGVSFGEKYRRSGGKALDFYASICLWLSEIGKIKKTIKGIERVVGIDIKTNCKKNKVSLPFRQVEYPIVFGYGIDDVAASLEWLAKIKELSSLGEIVDDKEKCDAALIKKVKDKMRVSKQEANRIKKAVDEAVIENWIRIETEFLPTESKY